MRKVYYFLSVLAAALFLASCQEKPLDPVSVITVDSKTQNDFDKWLEANYVNPYNILVKYRYEMNESDFSYYTIPAELDCSIVLAHLVKYLCIDTYDEVAGVRFTQKYFPKEFFYIGEWEYKNNGTYILGTAEGGKKILLSGVNYVPLVLQGGYQGHSDPKEALNHFYIKTIHHEFTHILNQTKDFPSEFSMVTPSDYVTDSWSTPNYASYYRQRGFISTYAQHSDREDFAEMMSMYVTNTEETFQSWLEAAGRKVTESDMNPSASTYEEFHTTFPSLKVGDTFPGAANLLAKLDLVRKYMADTFGIDIDELRDAILRRQDEVMSGMVDLTSLEVY
jgi:substrate import-associated zinc metallohydrolase lipoprotein